MPIIDGEYVVNYTSSQLDTILYNMSNGVVDYSIYTPTPYSVFSNLNIEPSTTSNNSTLYDTGNIVKAVVTFTQRGNSIDSTLILYGTSYKDLSKSYVLTVMNIGIDTKSYAIEPSWIPKYMYCKITNNDDENIAVCDVDFTLWFKT